MTTSSYESSIRAAGFEARKIHESAHDPSYTSWVSLFPGERGQWYIGVVELRATDPPKPGMSAEHFYITGLPANYDHMPLHLDMVILESTDGMRTWTEVSRYGGQDVQRAGYGAFAQARTGDGRFLRFLWTCYQPPEEHRHPGEIFYVSEDNGESWQLQPPFHDRRFSSNAHRVRTLRDGTIVLALPYSLGWGPGYELPTRLATITESESAMQMALHYSSDQGHTWSPPVFIYGGHTVSETDFAELPSGDLVCVNNSIFGRPGRQMVHRTERGWVAGFYERSRGETKCGERNQVPETICLTDDGILVGCMRAGRYSWSDDLGLTWYPLEGIPDRGPEVYQPWIEALEDGRIVCAGHYGADDAYGTRRQYVALHRFRLEGSLQRAETRIDVKRDYDQRQGRWPNSYTLTLWGGDMPIVGKELVFWYAEKGEGGYDSWNTDPIEMRMKKGGTIIRVRTGDEGTAEIRLTKFDEIEDLHHSYQFIVRFNMERTDLEHKPCQSPLFEFYCNSFQPRGGKRPAG